MSNASKNAFKGYTYQEAIFRFFVLLMDINKDIESVEAEINTDGTHNYDDIRVKINNVEYNIQSKNIKSGKPSFDNKTLTIAQGSSKTKVKKDSECIYFYNSDVAVYESNFKFLDIKSYKLNNIYLINMTTDMLWNYICDNFSVSTRIIQIIKLIDSKVTEGYNLITADELPEYSFYSTSLQENTLRIREKLIDLDKGPVFVEGKPGVGKSHLVNELEIDKSSLYRFWISDNDKDRNNRLLFDFFIKEVSIKLFRNSRNYSVDKIKDEISKREKHFFFDGLDHIENYNKRELIKYIVFFNDLIDMKANIVILSRPLKANELNINKIKVVLCNWSYSETIDYCTFSGIVEHKIKIDIYNLSNGYPILTRYLVEEHKQTGRISLTSKLDSVDSYYKEIINLTSANEKVLQLLSHFPSYFTIDEIVELIPENSDIIMDFIKERPYLFERMMNRYYFFHDSFINYLTQMEETQTIIKQKEKIYECIRKSILSESIEYMGRLSNFRGLNSKFLNDVFTKYSSLIKFKDLSFRNLDYESIVDFYLFIRKNLNDVNEKLRTSLKLYELSLIILIAERDNIDDQYDLLYQIWYYYKKNKVDYTQWFYSNGSIVNAFNYFEDLDLAKFKQNDELINVIQKASYTIGNSIISEELFFGRYNDDKYNIIIDYITEQKDSYLQTELILELLVYMWKFKHEESPIYIDVCRFLEDKINSKVLYQILYGYLYSLKDNTKFTYLYFPINSLRKTIHKLGFFENKNPYLTNSIKDIIKINSINGSWDIAEDLASVIRLANRKETQLDIENISLYFPMYYRRKDYSVYYLPDVFKLVYNFKNKKHLNYCSSVIDKFQQMSEKGIRDLYANFINNLCGVEFKIARKLNLFNPEKFNLFVAWLSKETINNLDINEVTKIVGHSLHTVNNSISFDSLKSINESRHSDEINELLKFWKVKIEHREETKFDEEIIYTPGSHFEDGYLDERDIEYLRDKKINIKEVSSMIDGDLCSLPYVNLFDIYDNKEVKENLNTVLSNSILAETEHGYKARLMKMIYTAPFMCMKYKARISKRKFRKIIELFIQISLIED